MMRSTIYLIVLILGFMNHPQAAAIHYEAKHIIANRWEYTYTIKNGEVSDNIEQFAIYFSPDNYRNLTANTSPQGWDTIANEPSAPPFEGLYDSLTLASGISPNSSLSGFSISFDYLGSGSPGSQAYDILDPKTQLTVESGITMSTVPLPGTLGMFILGLSLLTYMHIHNSKKRRLIAY